MVQVATLKLYSNETLLLALHFFLRVCRSLIEWEADHVFLDCEDSIGLYFCVMFEGCVSCSSKKKTQLQSQG